MKYKNHEIKRGFATTDVIVERGISCYSRVAYLYAISGIYGKTEGLRPFLTSIAECKEWINEKIRESKNAI